MSIQHKPFMSCDGFYPILYATPFLVIHCCFLQQPYSYLKTITPLPLGLTQTEQIHFFYLFLIGHS